MCERSLCSTGSPACSATTTIRSASRRGSSSSSATPSPTPTLTHLRAASMTLPCKRRAWPATPASGRGGSEPASRAQVPVSADPSSSSSCSRGARSPPRDPSPDAGRARRENRYIRPDQGRYLADNITGAPMSSASATPSDFRRSLVVRVPPRFHVPHSLSLPALSTSYRPRLTMQSAWCSRTLDPCRSTSPLDATSPSTWRLQRSWRPSCPSTTT